MRAKQVHSFHYKLVLLINKRAELELSLMAIEVKRSVKVLEKLSLTVWVQRWAIPPRFSEYPKLFDGTVGPVVEQWAPAVPAGAPMAPAAPLWRQPRPAVTAKMGAPPPQAIPQGLPQGLPQGPPPPAPAVFYPADEACVYTDAWRDADPTLPPAGMAYTTPNGIMSLRLHGSVRVDMTVDRAVRVINFKVRGHVIIRIPKEK